MKIISLYPINDVYQVVDEEDHSCYFQGSQVDCKKFIKKFKRNEQLRVKELSKLYHQTILKRNIKTTRTMKFEKIDLAKDYDGLVIQFNALKAIAISQQEQIKHYQKRVEEFSVGRIIQLEAELESEKAMNDILTKESNYKQQEQCKCGKPKVGGYICQRTDCNQTFK